MAIPITCSGCKAVFNLSDSLAGKKVRCKVCGESISVGAITPPGTSEDAQVTRTPSGPAMPAPADSPQQAGEKALNAAAAFPKKELPPLPPMKRSFPVVLVLAGVLLVGLMVLLACGVGGTVGYVLGVFPKKDANQDSKEAPHPGSAETKLPASFLVDLGDGLKMEFVLIDPKSKPDGGAFQMGDPKGQMEDKPHLVRLVKPYYLGKYVVTQEQYKQVAGSNLSCFREGGMGAAKVDGLKTEKFPVERVSWIDADAYCTRLMEKAGAQLPVELRQKGYRFALPTEAQWEYACRAGTKTSYFYGDDPKKLTDHAWCAENSGGHTHAVTEKDTSNPWGLYDMYGNVWQWCQDWYGPYDGLPQEEPLRSERVAEEFHVLRGGNWFINDTGCRAGCRYRNRPTVGGNFWGFRVGVRQD
jgi:formylglycine-generating enzyme required for sulfatase activity